MSLLITAGRSRDEIIVWIGTDRNRALLVLREVSEDVVARGEEPTADELGLLWDCHRIINPS